MLKKLFSYDFSAIGKKMWLFSIILLCTTAVGCGAMSLLTYFDWDRFEMGAGGLMAGLIMLVVISYTAIVAYGVIALVVIISRFYKNLFTDEGYLTFTLPVKTGTIYDAKFLAGCLWTVIVSAVEIVCFTILMMFTISFEHLPEVIAGIAEAIKAFFEYVPAGHIVAFGFEFVAICALSLAYNIVLLYISITIASIIAKKARFVIGTVFYFLINSVVGTVSSVFMTFGMIFFSGGMVMNVEDDAAEIMNFMYGQFHYQFIVNIFIFGGAVVAGYIVNKNLLKNKLNLP